MEAYKSRMVGHLNFKLTPCGFFVDEQTPYLGASPDALVECSCCGCGVVEVKCPLCASNARSLDDVVQERKKFCLQRLETGLLQLSREHPYHLQCQLQMHVTRRQYCDFVVWHDAGLHVERLTIDSQQLKDAIAKAEQFFRLCALPELCGKWYTRSHKPLSEIQPADIYSEEEDDGRWCYCRDSKGGDMVACDNKNCGIKWFHMSCLKMTKAPSGKWLCPSCHPTKKKKNYDSNSSNATKNQPEM